MAEGLVPFAGLVGVLADVLLLEVAHSLDFVEIDDEALFFAVVLLDALAAEDGVVVRAVEVADALLVLLTQFLLQCVFIFIFEIKVRLLQDGILLHNFEKNVDVQRQTLRTFQLLHKFAAHGASHPILVVQLSDAGGAERVPAMNQYTRDALADVVLQSAVGADIEPARLVIQVHDICSAAHHL